MNYICQKSLSLYGTQYKPGDIIPAERVASTRVRALKTCGYITDEPVVDDAAASAAETPDDDMVYVSILRDGQNELVVPISKDDAARILCILQKTADDAIADIGEIANENALIVIHATDGRKSVKNAAKDRASSLFTNGATADSAAS